MDLYAWFLQWLAAQKGLTLEEGASLRLELLSFPEGGLGLLTLVGIGLAVLFVAAVYRKDAARLSVGMRVLLAGLRTAAVVTLLLVFLEPSLVVVKREVRPGHTILLIDKSRSMGYRDSYHRSEDYRTAWERIGAADLASLSRLDLARKLLSQQDSLAIRRLAEKNQLLVYTFDGTLHGAPLLEEPKPAGPDKPPEPRSEAVLQVPKVDLQRIEADGPLTNLRDTIRGAMERSLYANVAALVVLTDGRRNAGLRADEAGRTLKQRKVDRVVVVGIGDPAETQQVEVSEFEAPERAFQRDPFHLKARLVARGYGPMTVPVRLVEIPVATGTGTGTPQQGRVIESRDVQLGGETPEAPIEFAPILAAAPGKFDYRVEIDPPTGETLQEQRHRKQARVEVLSEQTKVLLIAGVPTYEYQTLRTFLIRDKTIDVSCWLQSADLDFVQEGDTVLKELPTERKLLEPYDVILFMDPDPAKLDRAFCELLRKQVEEQGTGLLYVAGEKFTYPAFLETSPLKPVMELLPIIADEAKAKFEHGFGRYFTPSWPWELTPTGKDHKIVRVAEASAEANELLWSKFEGYRWSFRVARGKPAAEILAGHSDPQRRTSEGAEPVIATQFVGAGRVLWHGSDELYRWRSTAETEYGRYWVKAIRYLYEGRIMGGASRFRISVAEPVYEIGQEVRIQVRARDENYEPLRAAEVRLRAHSDRGADKTLTLGAVAGKPGLFEGSLQPAEGLWELTGSSDLVNGHKPATVTFNVIPSQAESEGPMARQELGDLATAAGGQFVMADQFLAALDGIPSREARQTIRIPHPIWDSWVSLALILFFLSLEWILRKQRNLL